MKIQLTDLVGVFRQMPNRIWQNGLLVGQITAKDQAMVDLLAELLLEENADIFPCIIEEGDPSNIKIGDSLTLRFGAPRTNIGHIVESLDSLLENSEIAAGTRESNWYVFNDDVASWEDTSDISQRLAMIKRLVMALEFSATLFDHRKSVLIFTSEGRFDVPIKYDAKALKNLNLAVAEKLAQALEVDDGHSKQKHEICATAIQKLLSTVSIKLRFSYLLENLNELKVKFDDGYRLFASSFSFEKVREEAEELRLEYTGKIHKTLTEIQGQLLGIPVSTIVVATQFKNTNAAIGQVWINIAVLAGAAIFVFLLAIAVINQFFSLGVISDEVDRHEKALKDVSNELGEKLADVFNQLRNRILWHQIALLVVMAIAIASLMLAFSVFWILST